VALERKHISALRRGEDAVLALRRVTTDTPLWLSSVVLEELYAGAGQHESRVVERMERDFDRAKRILVPNLRDWTWAGKVLARLAGKYHLRGDRTRTAHQRCNHCDERQPTGDNREEM
jgi:predicted nucleic acid-binding protein